MNLVERIKDFLYYPKKEHVEVITSDSFTGEISELVEARNSTGLETDGSTGTTYDAAVIQTDSNEYYVELDYKNNYSEGDIVELETISHIRELYIPKESGDKLYSQEEVYQKTQIVSKNT